MDPDHFWDAYRQDAETWDEDKINHELKLLRSDLDAGMIDRRSYIEAKTLLEGILYQKTYEPKTYSPEELYDRAMKGI